MKRPRIALWIKENMWIPTQRQIGLGIEAEFARARAKRATSDVIREYYERYAANLEDFGEYQGGWLWRWAVRRVASFTASERQHHLRTYSSNRIARRMDRLITGLYGGPTKFRIAFTDDDNRNS